MAIKFAVDGPGDHRWRDSSIANFVKIWTSHIKPAVW